LQPVIIVPGSKKTFWGNKNDTAATIDKLVGYDVLDQVKIIEMNDEKHLLELLEEHKIKVVVHISAYLDKEIHSYVLPKSKDKGVKWCVLGSNGDELRVVDYDRGEIIEKWDLITIVNDLWRKWIVEYLESVNPQKVKYAQDTIPIGNPILDQISQLKFKKGDILTKYNLPAGKKMIFLAPLADYSIPLIYKMVFFSKFMAKIINLPILKQLFKKYIRGRKNALIKDFDIIYNYADILRKIRCFADNNNAVIICKRRHKDKELKKCEKKYIDIIFEEGSFYPFLTLELMSAVDVYVGFESLCLLEAISLGKPAVNLISPMRMYFSDTGLNGVNWNKLWLDENAIFKIKNVSDVYKLYESKGWDEFCQKMKGSLTEQIQKYDNNHREQLLKTFLGSTEFNSSRRFLNAVEKIL